MTDRSYTVAEIDALRRAVENQFLWGTYHCPQQNGISRSYTEAEKVRTVEERVRTWMLAGKTAQDLYDSERPASGSTSCPQSEKP